MREVLMTNFKPGNGDLLFICGDFSQGEKEYIHGKIKAIYPEQKTACVIFLPKIIDIYNTNIRDFKKLLKKIENRSKKHS